jgi:pimeloyl-ACP methyl ester carboxylesterase
MSNTLAYGELHAAPPRPEVPSLTRDNLIVHSAGEGPPLVLLHGLASSHHEWRDLKMALARDYTCIAWDACGHGEHAVGSASPCVADLARDLRTAVAALVPRKPVVVGHSLGAITVLEFVRRFGADSLSGVVLIDQTPRMLTGTDWQLGIYNGFSPAENIVFESQLHRDPAETYLHLMASGFNARALADYEADALPVQRVRNRLRRMHAALMLPLWKSFVHKDYRDEVAALGIPLLVVLGGASNLYDALRLSRWYAEAAPHAQVVRYDGADHAPHLAAPARFARDLAGFAARCHGRVARGAASLLRALPPLPAEVAA